MRVTKPSSLAAFAPVLSFFKIVLNKKTKQKPIVHFSARSKYIWGAFCMSIAISYNSCVLQYAPTLEKQKPALAAPLKPAPIDNRKTIYLTFDDGPNKGTANVMKVLEKEKVPATFFLVGEHVYGTPWQKAICDYILQNPNYDAANHTFFHAKNRYNKFYQHPEQVLADFQRMQDSLRFPLTIGRTPGMDVWRTAEIKYDVCKRSVKAADLVQSNGFTLIGWDVEWKADGKRHLKKTAAALASEIAATFAERLTHTDDHLVLLLHDQHYVNDANVQALEALISQLKETGDYRFEKVSGYPCL
jgi:peptidoglycan/xylan/chitin deacetylase (PgdA/CDA1 family)